MAAIAYPNTPTIPTLRLLPTAGSRTPGAVYWRRRVAALVAVLVAVLVGLLIIATFFRAVVVPGGEATTVRTGSGTGTVLVSDLGAYGAPGATLPDRAVYVVRPGDTLWSIARRVAPGGDVTESVARLADLNGSSAVQVGQRLRLD